jgi:uncharacterized protein (TIGR02646 family)
MKYVFKGSEPASFKAWKSLENDSWVPTYSDLQNPEKQSVHQSLLDEQGHVCCYCGGRIALDSSHIEHFRPQERFEALALDYGNLFASCLRTKTKYSPIHCGHLKDNWFDEQRHINPSDSQCEQRFCYLLNGNIKTTLNTDNSAYEMINVLALDIACLKNRREEALRGIFDDEFLTTATEAELRELLSVFRTRQDGIYPSFGHVIARYCEQLIG